MAEIKDWKDINIKVDENYTQNANKARVKIMVSIGLDTSNATVTLKLINENYDSLDPIDK